MRSPLLLGCVAVAVVALVVLAVVLLGGDPSRSTSAGRVTVAETGLSPDTTVPSTTTTSVPPATVITVATTVAVPLTVAPTVVATIALQPPVTQPPITQPPATVAVQPPVTVPPVSEGDLGLSVPISRPACDGRFVTMLGASDQPSGYAVDVEKLLQRYQGAHYMRTDLVCPSLRWVSKVTGEAIYSVFYGPYSTALEACNARAFGPSDAYVKVLDHVTPFTDDGPCG